MQKPILKTNPENQTVIRIYTELCLITLIEYIPFDKILQLRSGKLDNLFLIRKN